MPLSTRIVVRCSLNRSVMSFGSGHVSALSHSHTSDAPNEPLMAQSHRCMRFAPRDDWGEHETWIELMGLCPPDHFIAAQSPDYSRKSSKATNRHCSPDLLTYAECSDREGKASILVWDGPTSSKILHGSRLATSMLDGGYSNNGTVLRICRYLALICPSTSCPPLRYSIRHP